MATQQPGKEAVNVQSKQSASRARAARVATQETQVIGGLDDVKTTRDRVGTVRQLLQDLGLRAEGLARLTADEIVQLAGFLSSDGQRSKLVCSMFNAVTDTTPEKVSRLLKVVETYSGSSTILEAFLIHLGERNPFLAAEKAQILVLPSNDTGTARGASGHILKGVTYCAYDPAMPSNSTGYLSGRQAIAKIFEAFSPDRMSDTTKERVRTRRSAELRRALRDIDLESVTLEELEVQPALRDELRSQLITRNLAVYDELRKAIEDYKGQLSDMVYGGEIILPGINSLRVSQDPGRQFLGWFQEHFKENPNAPQGIKIAYASISDENVALSEAEEAYYLRGLLAYQRMHSYINKATALGGLVGDLEIYEGLELNDPLRLDPAIESARRTLRHTIASTPAELSIAEFSDMLENSAMVQFRRDMNQRVLDLYRADFEKALELFEFVSFDRGTWREDALGDSVPMERLRQHLYGAKIGVVSGWDGPNKKRAALGQSDFRHIMDAQLLKRLVASEDKLLNAKPIAEFKAMVEGVVVAYRKALFLEARLSEFASTPEGAAATQAFDREVVGESLAAWKPVLPLGTNFKPAEAWYLETQSPKPQLQSLADIADRLRDRKSYFFQAPLGTKDPLRDQYDKHVSEIEHFSKAGLYRPEMGELWRAFEQKVATLVPTSQYSESYQEAARLVAHPMVFRTGYFTTEMLTRRFALPHEIVAVERLASISEQVDTVCAGFNRTELGELRTRMERLDGAHLYIGEIGTYNSGRGRLGVMGQSFPQFAGAVSPCGDFSSEHYYNPAKLVEALAQLEASFVSTRDLGLDWVERAKTLCSKSGKTSLNSKGFDLVDNETYRLIRYIVPMETLLVDREFAAIVDQMIPRSSM